MLPIKLDKDCVVAINEFPPRGIPPTGHVDVSFFYHGIDQGTYGQNSKGKDIKGKYHHLGMSGTSVLGGVYVEDEKNAKIHYVIVSVKNYFVMLNYARSRAKLSAFTQTTYGFIFNNCADFVYQVFAVSDLTFKQKDIAQYLGDGTEPVALYADARASAYTVHDTRASAKQ